MRNLIVFLLSMCLVGMAQAQTWTKTPVATGSTCSKTLSKKQTCYFVFDDTDNADSPLINIENLADACFDPELEGTGTSTAEVAIRKCQNTTQSANSCERVTVDVDGDGDVDNGILDGDSGSVSAAQRMCIYDLSRGLYYIEVSTNPGGGETAVLTLTGH